MSRWWWVGRQRIPREHSWEYAAPRTVFCAPLDAVQRGSTEETRNETHLAWYRGRPRDSGCRRSCFRTGEGVKKNGYFEVVVRTVDGGLRVPRPEKCERNAYLCEFGNGFQLDVSLPRHVLALPHLFGPVSVDLRLLSRLWAPSHIRTHWHKTISPSRILVSYSISPSPTTLPTAYPLVVFSHHER